MANIRVTCPTCGKALEVGAEHEGKEVECGECFQVFVAKGPDQPKIKVVLTHGLPAGKKPPTRKRRDDDEYEHDKARRDDEDDNYAPPSRRGGGGAQGTGPAVAGLVLAVFGLITSCCPAAGFLFGILGIVLGAAGKNYPGAAGTAIAAQVIGSIAVVISVGVIAIVFMAGAWNAPGN